LSSSALSDEERLQWSVSEEFGGKLLFDRHYLKRTNTAREFFAYVLSTQKVSRASPAGATKPAAVKLNLAKSRKVGRASRLGYTK
jgi:hypothetical protein